MKKIKLFVIALVAMCGFSACEKECDHNFIEVDYNKELVGTWTCLQNGYAEALVISADGSAVSTGIEDGEYWEGIKGNIKTINNKMTMTFEDGDNWEGRFEMLSGKAFTIFEENGETFTYNYCAKDLSDEIVGMWVCTETPSAEENDMLVMTYNADGTTLFTGYAYEADVFSKNIEASYKVIGDLLIHKQPDIAVEYGLVQYNAMKIKYTPNGTAFGDVKTIQAYAKVGENYIETSTSWLRIKQSLNLTGKTYDYNSAYVTNAKGTDEDFTMLGHTFNMANINAGNFDMMFRSELFCVDLNANSITQRFRANGRDIEIEIPITVEGNKVTLDLSTENPAYREVDMYMFQDADDCQLHMYMHTDAFINYFANMELYNLLASGEITSDTAAIEKVFADMEARVESINVSFVLKARE